MSHANISVFVPHLGCPHRCAFCDQHSITGQTAVPTEKDIDKAVAEAKASKRYAAESTELAFFGGSFTAIDRELMLLLLRAGYKHIKAKNVCGIRISTRPDCIDEEVLQILKEHGVTAIELGAQSMCDEVLSANDRGHTVSDVENASRLIKAFGFKLGLQMMTGLYKSNDELDIVTAEKIIAQKPDTVRIYPVITLKNTCLARLFEKGEYIPPSLEDAVRLCTKLLEIFQNADIKVIRTGLHSIEPENYVAGPWHPSFKELCDSRRMLLKVLELLPEKGEYTLFVNPKDVSKMTGNKKKNINELKKLGYICCVTERDDILSGSVVYERMDESCF